MYIKVKKKQNYIGLVDIIIPK